MDRSTPRSGFAKTWRLLVATGGAMLMMLACFLLLPVLQAISATVPKDLELREVDTAALPPPPPPIEEEKQEEKPPEDAKQRQRVLGKLNALVQQWVYDVSVKKVRGARATRVLVLVVGVVDRQVAEPHG